MIRKFFLMGFVLCLGLPGFGQLKFSRFDKGRELKLGKINHIELDSQGFLWLGSPGGLQRFDGGISELFYTDWEDSTSLLGSDVSFIKTDRNGYVWVSTHDGGLCRYNAATGKFERYRSGDNQHDLSRDAILTIHHDRRGNTWVGGSGLGLGRVDSVTRTIDFYPFSEGNQYVFDMIDDPRNADSMYVSGGAILWHCSTRTGICRKALEKPGTLTFYKLDIDEKGVVWASDYNRGLTMYDPSTGAHKTYRPTMPAYSRPAVLCYAPGKVWMSSRGGGILEFDTKTGTWTSILHDPDDPQSLGDNTLYTLFRHPKLGVWAGGNNGVSYMDPEDQFIHTYRIQPEEDITGVITQYIRHERLKKDFLAYLYQNKIIEIDKDGKHYDVPIEVLDKRHKPRPINLYQYHDDIIAVLSDGVAKYDPARRTFKRILFTSHQEGINRPSFGANFLDKSGNLWISKKDGWLYRVNLNDLSVKEIQLLKTPKTLKTSRAIFRKNENVFIELEGNVLKLNIPTGKITGYEEFFSQKQYPEIYSIFMEDDSTMWVSTWNRGIFRYRINDSGIEEMRNYTMKDGLPSNRMQDIYIDKRGNVYSSSTMGLVRKQKNSNVFEVIGPEHGLHPVEVNHLIENRGKIYLAHDHAYTVFDYKNYGSTKYPSKLWINALREREKEHILNPQNKKPIQVKYKNNDIAISFSAINFHYPKLIRCEYRLNNYHDWRNIQPYKSSKAFYSNLPAGKYTFEIREVLSDGTKGKAESLRFEVKPPFWQTWWFLLLSFIFLNGMIYLFVKWRIQQKQKEEKLAAYYEKQLSQLELTALRSQMNPHFMFNSLNSIKSYILKNETRLASEYLATFAHLIRLILQNSREKMTNLQTEIEMLIMYIDLEKMRFKEGFDFVCRIDSDIDMEDVEIPPMILQPFVENAIWHGLMHKTGKRVLTIEVQKAEDGILCIIDDTGIGRQKSAEIKKQQSKRYRSMGLNIIDKRLKLMQYLNSINIETKIEDKVGPHGEVLGTRVLIKIRHLH